VAEIQIKIPGNFLPERQYIVHTLFADFLGIEIEILLNDINDNYIITVKGGKKIFLKDSFFSKFKEPDGYLDKSNIPVSIFFLEGNIPGYDKTPYFFGDSELIFDSEKITVNADIFACAFYMLTRWEEYVIKKRDKFDRFIGSESLSIKFQFHKQPVVNEYAEVLWILLVRAGYKGEKNKREFRLVPTHDIDHMIFWNSIRKRLVIKNLLGDIFIRRDLPLAFRRIASCLASVFAIGEDPNLAFSYFMDLAEAAGCKACFYFFVKGDTKYDPDSYLHSTLFKRISSDIKKRTHLTGIHPSYKSYDKIHLMKAEINELADKTGIEVKESRQHYLRFQIPDTWLILNNCGVVTDSSMYFSGFPGFRSGSCYEFQVFDILGRKPLNLVERPLLVMDTCLLKYSAEEAAQLIREIKEQVIIYKGDFVFNWHNSNTKWNIPKGLLNCFESEFYGKQ